MLQRLRTDIPVEHYVALLNVKADLMEEKSYPHFDMARWGTANLRSRAARSLSREESQRWMIVGMEIGQAIQNRSRRAIATKRAAYGATGQSVGWSEDEKDEAKRQ